jgi:chlorophyllase
VKLLTFLLLGLLACGDDSGLRSQGDLDAGRDVATDADASAETGGDLGADGGATDSGADVAPDMPEPDAADDTSDTSDPEDAGDDGGDDAGEPDADASDIGEDAADTNEMDAGQEYDPAASGRFAAVTQSASVTRDGRTIPINVHSPDGAIGRPMVVLLPGFQLESRRYLGLAGHLASHGYVVVRADPPGGLFDVDHTAMADDVAVVIDWAIETLGGTVDPDKIAIAGHSLGGKVSFMAASRDPRIVAVFAIDPVNAGSPISGYSQTLPNIVPDEVQDLAIPVGIVGETLDATAPFGPACAPAGMNYVTITDAATSATWLAEWTFADTSHMDFVDDKSGCGFTCSACRDGGASEADVQASLRTLAVAFVRLHFDGDAEMEAWLTGDSLPAGVTQR